jgi:hypothetical protein
VEDTDKKETLSEVQEMCKKVNDNIIFYSLGVTRSGKSQVK